MKKTRQVHWNWRVLSGIIMLVLVIGLSMDLFSITSYAQSQGKVIASSAKIRKETNTGSEVLGSVAKDDSLTINNQTTASDGTVWYQVFVDADTLGYIRSDLVQITDGTTPPTANATSPAATQAPTATQAPAATQAPVINETPAEVTAVQPLSATVSGGSSVRVRGNASTTSQIVTTVQNGMALTVTGQASGSDGKTWYQVTFIADGTEATGFIRSDFVTLSGEPIPLNQEPTEPEEGAGEEPAASEEPEEPKAWETSMQGEDWYLLDMVGNEQYKIEDLFSAVENNKALYEASQKQLDSQKAITIILVIIITVLAAAVIYLIFKMKDMVDSAYFSEVENETMRRRSVSKAQGGRNVMPTVGAEKKAAQGRPTGQGRPVAPSQGSKPSAPQGRTVVPPQGGRPTGAPQGRPVSQPQGNRPAGAPQGRPVMPPQNGRPAGTPQDTRPMTPTQGGRPMGAPSQGGRPVAPPQNSRPAGAQPRENTVKQGNNQQNPGWKSKNFMSDEDEFEFEFLNWDEDEE